MRKIKEIQEISAGPATVNNLLKLGWELVSVVAVPYGIKYIVGKPEEVGIEMPKKK